MIIIDAFIQALQSGDVETVRTYLAENPDAVNQRLPKWAENRAGTAPLHCAACFNQLAVMNLLVKTFHADVNYKVPDTACWTPLDYAVNTKAHLLGRC